MYQRQNNKFASFEQRMEHDQGLYSSTIFLHKIVEKYKDIKYFLDTFYINVYIS